jgi:hypothetical protein
MYDKELYAPPPEPKHKGPRAASTYRAARRNGRWRWFKPLNTRPQAQVERAGAMSQRARLIDLKAELQLKSMARAGRLPPPHTKEGQLLRAMLAGFAPKRGPGKPSVTTLHRKIAIAELREARRNERELQLSVLQ